jgi:hypothetical protein
VRSNRAFLLLRTFVIIQWRGRCDKCIRQKEKTTLKYALRRILALFITMILVSFLAFAAFHIISGDPARAILGMNATEKQLALLRQELGLDKPFLVQYFNWLLGFFSGNLGISYSYRQPVASLILFFAEAQKESSPYPGSCCMLVSVRARSISGCAPSV